MPPTSSKLRQINDPIHPSNVLVGIEKESGNLAKKGLAMALGDVVEATAGYSVQEVANLDKHFSDNRAPTLTEVRLRFSKRLKTVLRRKFIKSEEEYYLVRNAVEFSEDKQRQIMWSLIAEYESRI